MPVQGNNTINGGWFDNGIDIYIGNYGSGTTTLNMSAASFPSAGSVAKQALKYSGESQPVDIYMASDFNTLYLTGAFERSERTVLLNRDGQTQYLYFRESGKDYLLGDTSDNRARRVAPMIPNALADMTNGELWNTYHVVLNGLVAPDNARVLPGSIGLVSPTPPPQAPPKLILRSRWLTDQLTGYTLTVKNEKNQVVDLTTVDLKPDQWNFVSADYQGQTVTFAIYAKEANPTFKVADSRYRPITGEPTITQAQLAKGLTIYGRINDQVGDVPIIQNFVQTFQPSALVVNSDGKVRVWVVFKDLVGREQRRQLELTVVN